MKFFFGSGTCITHKRTWQPLKLLNSDCLYYMHSWSKMKKGLPIYNTASLSKNHTINTWLHTIPDKGRNHFTHTHMYTINILHLPEYKRNVWKMPPWPKYLQSFSKISKENICNRVHSYKIAPPPLSRWQIMKKFLPSVKGKKYKYHVNSLQISTTGMASEVSVCLRFLSGSVCQ